MAEFDKNMLNKVKKFFEKFFQKSQFTIFTKELHALLPISIILLVKKLQFITKKNRHFKKIFLIVFIVKK